MLELSATISNHRNSADDKTAGHWRTATGTGLNSHPDYHAEMIKELTHLTGILYQFGNP